MVGQWGQGLYLNLFFVLYLAYCTSYSQSSQIISQMGNCVKDFHTTKQKKAISFYDLCSGLIFYLFVIFVVVVFNGKFL